jgi:murein DD-endopeptidase MepM/ murein hydrolase activator NlpD
MKLTLKTPVVPFKINQEFGVNGTYYQQNGINIIGHNGLDLFAPHGEPVLASHDGTAYIEVDKNQGHGVVVLSDRTYEIEGKEVFIKTIYWHLVDPKKDKRYPYPIKSGERVRAGQIIGYADNTGFSTGSHLHYGLKTVLPGEKPFVWYNTKQNNGYQGAIDPMPYMEITLMKKLLELYKKLVSLLKK